MNDLSAEKQFHNRYRVVNMFFWEFSLLVTLIRKVLANFQQIIQETTALVRPLKTIRATFTALCSVQHFSFSWRISKNY